MNNCAHKLVTIDLSHQSDVKAIRSCRWTRVRSVARLGIYVDRKINAQAKQNPKWVQSAFASFCIFVFFPKSRVSKQSAAVEIDN
jgi:hypothetical protein